MLPVESDISILVARASDTNQTAPERAAAINAALRIAEKSGIAIRLPDPPPGYAMRGGRAVRVESSIPPLRAVPDRWDELGWKRRLFGDEDVEATPEPEIVPLPAPATARRLSPMQDIVLRLVGRGDGASLAELTAATRSSDISVRATISVLRRTGATIALDRNARRYRASEPSRQDG